MLDVMNADKQSELVTKLVQAWESKNAKRVARGAVLSTMALSLAACGGSSDPVADDSAADDAAADDATADDAVTTATLSALQSEAVGLLTSIAASDAAVEAATIAAGGTAAVNAFNGVTLAPATAAAATTNFNAALAAVQNDIVAGAGNVSGGLEASAVVGSYATTTYATLAAAVTADTALTPAQITALATADAALAAAFDFEASSDANTVLGAKIAANGGVALVAATSGAAAAGIGAIGAHVGANLANSILVADAVAATAAETLAGQVALAGLVGAALLANDATYAAAYAAATAANQTVVNDAVLAAVQAQVTAGNVTQNANTGEVTGVTSTNALLTAAAVAVATTGVADPTGAEIITMTDGAGAAAVAAAAAQVALVDAITTATVDQAVDAAFIAAYEALMASVDAIVDADAASQIAAIEAANVATVSLGVDNIDINGGAATSGNDVFIFNEAGGNLTIGTAATAAAPGNVLFGAGEDSVIILGEYTLVTVASAAAQAALATTNVGDASVLEAFVYQNATTGDTVISFEENAYDGNTTAGTAMTTLTLTDITWADVTVDVIDGNMVLSTEAAVA